MKTENKTSTAKKVDKKKVMSDEKIEALTNEIFGEEKPEVKTQKPKLANIKLDKLHPFENHPYKVLDDESMLELKDSIAEQGILNRIIVRPLEDKPEEYEIISGHRRVYAANLLGMKEIPASIHFISRDEATILMVDSNIQRESVSVMEKGKAYRMKFEALSHQGKSTSDHNGPKLTVEQISDKDSPSQVKRFIRLTYLVPELQQLVDQGKMKMLPAVEISYLNEESQRDIVDRIDETEIFPSHAQARRMKTMFEEGALDYDAVTEIMSELKPNQVEKLKIPMDNIRKYVPQNSSPKDIEQHLIKLAKQDFERKQRSRDDAR